MTHAHRAMFLSGPALPAVKMTEGRSTLERLSFHAS